MRYAQSADQTGSKKTGARAASGSTSSYQRRKHQEGAKHRFTDGQKAQAVKMRAEGMSLSAAARVVGASVTTVSKWVKKRGIGKRASEAAFSVVDKWAAEWRPRVCGGV